jgi:hypothetical protein
VQVAAPALATVGAALILSLIGSRLAAAGCAEPSGRISLPTCFAFAAADPPQSEGLAAPGWRLVRTPTGGGSEAVSIMHTADTAPSDLDLAGLTIRCGEHGLETLVVVIKPRPPRAKPHVSIGIGSDTRDFEASVVPPFSLLLLPAEAGTLITGAWQATPALSIHIEDGETTVSGFVPIAGLPAALQKLIASCPAQSR